MDGQTNGEALRKAWLSVGTTKRLLENLLRQNLASIGVLTFGGGRFTGSTDEGQLTIVLIAQAYLYPALPQRDRDEMLEMFSDLEGHNWGMVRRAAGAALSQIRVLDRFATTTIIRTQR
jgi:hypothetical protein